MKRSKKALLIALVIGDGYIKVDKRIKNPKTAELSLCHSSKQREYVEYKARLLHKLLGGKEPKVREYMCKSNFGNYKQIRVSKSHKYFKILHSWLYPDKFNKKYLKYLTPHALAIWFMDDGSCVPNNRHKDGTVSSVRTQLHLCEPKEKAQEVCDYFMEEWEIKMTPYKERGDSYSIRCFHGEGKKFHELIRPYIIPSMEYKQRFYYPKSAQPTKYCGDDIV